MDLDLLLRVLRQMKGEKQFAIPITLSKTLFLVPPSPSLAERLNEMNARMPKFMRSSVMEDKSSIVSGALRRIFLSRAELIRRYGGAHHWFAVYRKYLSHFSFLIGEHFVGKNWRLGRDTIPLTTHFKKIASLRDKIKS